MALHDSIDEEIVNAIDGVYRLQCRQDEIVRPDVKLPRQIMYVDGVSVLLDLLRDAVVVIVHCKTTLRLNSIPRDKGYPATSQSNRPPPARGRCEGHPHHRRTVPRTVGPTCRDRASALILVPYVAN